jgi:purine-cytosine permease-like protein
MQGRTQIIGVVYIVISLLIIGGGAAMIIVFGVDTTPLLSGLMFILFGLLFLLITAFSMREPGNKKLS